MATHITFKFFVFYALLLIAINAHAAGTCLADKSDIQADTQQIVAKLFTRYGCNPLVDCKNVSTENTDLSKIYDSQELKVDRSLPFLNLTEAVGIYTDKPLNSATISGSATLVSPCHLLIPAHGILTSSVKNGTAPIFISIGQSTCDSPNEFLHQDIIGKVIAVGEYPENLDKINPALDYAIVRIPQIVDIKPALIASEYMSPANSLMVVGFPLKYTFYSKTGFRYPTANFVRMRNIGSDGSFTSSNTKNGFGSSGSGVFILDDDKGRPILIVAGMIRGRLGWGIQTAAILKRLKKDSPEVYKELGVAIKNKSCDSIK